MVLQGLLLVLVAAGGTLVVLTRDPKRQAFVLGLYGLTLTLLFFVLRAPDVALSELVVGAAALPLMLLVALANVAKLRAAPRRGDEEGGEHE